MVDSNSNSSEVHRAMGKLSQQTVAADRALRNLKAGKEAVSGFIALDFGRFVGDYTTPNIVQE